MMPSTPSAASTDAAAVLARAERAAADLQQALADLRSLLAATPATVKSTTVDSAPAPSAVGGGHPDASEPATVVAAGVGAAAPSAVIRLCDHLEAMAAGLDQGQVGVDPALAAFLTRARSVLESAGGVLSDRLADVVGFLDRLAAAHPGTSYIPLHDAVAVARRLVIDAAPADLAIALPDPVQAGCRTRPAPVPRPLAMATGIAIAGQRRQEPLCLVPDPGASESAILGWGVLEDGWSVLRRQHRPALAAELAAAFAQLCEAWDPDPHRLRALLNAVTRHTEQIHGSGAQAAMAWFKRVGWTPYALKPGERWDPDRHDLVRYERLARSEGPALVEGIRQLGLLGPDRLPIQKCIVITG